MGASTVLPMRWISQISEFGTGLTVQRVILIMVVQIIHLINRYLPSLYQIQKDIGRKESLKTDLYQKVYYVNVRKDS